MRQVGHTYSPSTRVVQVRRITGLSECQPGSRFSENLCLKGLRQRMIEEHPTSFTGLHPHGHTGMCTTPVTPIPQKSLYTYSHSKNIITKTSVKYSMQFSHICTYMSINAYMYTCAHIIYICKSRGTESVLRDYSVISHISTYYLKYSICCKTCY